MSRKLRTGTLQIDIGAEPEAMGLMVVINIAYGEIDLGLDRQLGYLNTLLTFLWTKVKNHKSKTNKLS